MLCASLCACVVSVDALYPEFDFLDVVICSVHMLSV